MKTRNEGVKTAEGGFDALVAFRRRTHAKDGCLRFHVFSGTG
ncbi:hypothetical protein CLOSTASPAR_03886 [[Clostridium] asparagiforme DSM 15981]|uniref:Uncharacterized protein n=1 Tax=[Clostridium] asparagiforme DSM 15981 TaxID=518636 RepID=C0D3P5_9FIRM|nr:hypothetical protein CLOSTASPAR_03886 [[Clostridium] asparagiforme DSM 15981]